MYIRGVLSFTIHLACCWRATISAKPMETCSRFGSISWQNSKYCVYTVKCTLDDAWACLEKRKLEEVQESLEEG